MVSANNKLKVRQAIAEEAAACSIVLNSSIRRLCTADHLDDEQLIANWLENKTPQTMRQWIKSDAATIFVAEHEGKIVGVGGISGSEVALNYVSPSHRGLGVSTAMLNTLENELRNRGVRSAELNSTATAHNFYRKAGWVDAGEAMESMGIVGFPMKKLL